MEDRFWTLKSNLANSDTQNGSEKRGKIIEKDFWNISVTGERE
jgi:FPC/CPF motif-containing protein YcgG